MPAFPASSDLLLSAVRLSAKRIASFSVRHKLQDRHPGWQAVAQSAIDHLIAGSWTESLAFENAFESSVAFLFS